MIRETLSVDAGDVRLAVYVSGPRDAPPVVLVHGYPDSAAVWEPLRAQLDGGHRVISYDVRGAGASDAPAARSGYRLQRLAADLSAVVDATCGGKPFHLVGHDWGSIQSWQAVTDPQLKGRIASYTSMSGPCLDHAFDHALDRASRPRLRRRWQPPGLGVEAGGGVEELVLEAQSLELALQAAELPAQARWLDGARSAPLRI